MPDLSIVIPVHNEQENIETLLREVESVFLSSVINYEILVVDDGSTDNTTNVLRKLQSLSINLTVIQHTVNRGQSAALLSGVKQSKSAWIVTLDGDGQNDPLDILQLWDRRHSKLHQIFPIKMIAGQRIDRKDSFLRKKTSVIANKIRRFLLKDDTFDTGCGLKLFDREIFLKIPHFNHFHRFLPALFLSTGAKVISMNVNHRPRSFGKSHYGIHNRLWVGIIDLLGVYWLIRRSAPWELDTTVDIHKDHRDEDSVDGH